MYNNFKDFNLNQIEEIRNEFFRLKNDKNQKNNFLENLIKNNFKYNNNITIPEIIRFNLIFDILFERNQFLKFKNTNLKPEIFLKIINEKTYTESNKNNNLNFEHQTYYDKSETKQIKEIETELEKFRLYIIEQIDKNYKIRFNNNKNIDDSKIPIENLEEIYKKYLKIENNKKRKEIFFNKIIPENLKIEKLNEEQIKIIIDILSHLFEKEFWFQFKRLEIHPQVIYEQLNKNINNNLITTLEGKQFKESIIRKICDNYAQRYNISRSLI